jgi:hypothetical protein
LSNDFSNKISSLIPDQFPELYKQEGQNFIAFLRAYYEFLELQTSPVGDLRSRLSYIDIDETLEQFIIHFKNKYLYNIQFSTASNKRLFIKNSLDFYRSKGTPRAIDLFFRLVYGLPAEVYYPGEDLFRLSDGKWVKPKYLEITPTENNVAFIGQLVTGLETGATAFADRLVKRNINGKFVDILFVENIIGNFTIGERLVCPVLNKGMNLPKIIGSLSGVTITSGGSNFQLGNILDIESASGTSGKGTVASLGSQQGFVTFNLIDGGFGYKANSQVIVSNTVLALNNTVISSTTNFSPFSFFETVVSPVANINYISLAGGNLVANQTINEYTTGVLTGTGTILSVTPSNTTAGSILVAIDKLSNNSISNLQSNTKFFVTGNVISANIGSYTDRTVTGNVMGISSNSDLYVGEITGSFILGETVYQYNGANISGSGQISTIIPQGVGAILSITNVNGVFVSNNQLFANTTVSGELTTASANLISVSTSIGLTNIGTVPFQSGAFLFANTSNTRAIIMSSSGGNAATFSVGGIDNQELVSENTDLLSGNNTGGIPFLNVKVNGSNGNTGFANGLGFPAMPSGTMNTPIWELLTYQQYTVGRINSLTNINPGHNYTATPFVCVYDNYSAALELYDYTVEISNSTSQFMVGEIVTQNTVISGQETQINYSAITGTLQNGELVYQSNGTANIATGLVDIFTSNPNTVYINYVHGVFTTGFPVVGARSNASITVTSANSTINRVNKAVIKSITNGSILELKRLTKEEMVINSSAYPIIGSQTGARAYVIDEIEPYDPPQIGLNAVVDTDTIIANGVMTGLSIIGTGFGFSNNEIVTITTEDNSSIATGIVSTSSLGFGQGYYSSNKGFLSDSIYLLDSDFYQEYSYQIISKLPLDYYKSQAKKVLHVAGTRMFGKVDLSSNTQSIITEISEGNSSITVINGQYNLSIGDLSGFNLVAGIT